MRWYAWSIVGSTGVSFLLEYSFWKCTGMKMTHVYHTNLKHTWGLPSLPQAICYVADLLFSASKIGMEFIPSAGFPFMVAPRIKSQTFIRLLAENGNWKWYFQIINWQKTTTDYYFALFAQTSPFLCFTFVSELSCWTGHKYWKTKPLHELDGKKFRSNKCSAHVIDCDAMLIQFECPIKILWNKAARGDL